MRGQKKNFIGKIIKKIMTRKVWFVSFLYLIFLGSVLMLGNVRWGKRNFERFVGLWGAICCVTDDGTLNKRNYLTSRN